MNDRNNKILQPKPAEPQKLCNRFVKEVLVIARFRVQLTINLMRGNLGENLVP